MFTLRPYQIEAVEAGVRCLEAGEGNGLMVEPTGSGKSLIIANIGARLNQPLLVFQPSKEILIQNLAKFRAYGYDPGVYSASMGLREVKDITLATIGSVKNAPELFEGRKIIIDEAHGVDPKKAKTREDGTIKKASMYRNFLDALEGSTVLGLTATPFRFYNEGWTDDDGLHTKSILKFLTRTRPRVFQELIHYTQIKELFDAGYLAKNEYKTMGCYDQSKLKVNTTGNDYTPTSVEKVFKSVNFKVMLLLEIRNQLAAGRKNVLVFTRSVPDSEYLAANLPNAAVVTTDTKPKERTQIGDRFKAGEIKVVCNYGIYTTGFDYPELETIVLGRPTLSLSLAMQMIGRGSRPHPEKEFCRIVDMVGLVERFGKIEDLHLTTEGFGKWYYESNGKPMTNVYYNESHNPYFKRKPVAKAAGGLPF